MEDVLKPWFRCARAAARALPLAAAAILIGAAGAPPAAAPAVAQAAKPLPTGARDFSGVWWTRTYSPRLVPVGGGALPFTPEGQELYRKNVEDLRAGTLEDHARVWCSPDGVPRIWLQPYPFRIDQTERDTAIVYERNATYRVIQMDAPVPPEEDWLPYFMGSSYGRWEGDALVVGVVSFNTRTFLDDTGVPHSDQLRVRERIRKIGNNELEVVATITDPVIFTRPFDVRFTFARRDDIQHFDFWVCGEPHRDVSQVQGAPR